jgi:hypothetical protein
MFEHHRAPLLSRAAFLRRALGFAGASGGLLAFSLALGTAGYHWLGELAWLDALLNAAMILTGMGPVDRLETAAGKVFATGYALYSGVAFLTMSGILFAPIVHRFFHRLHLEQDEPAATSSPAR